MRTIRQLLKKIKLTIRNSGGFEDTNTIGGEGWQQVLLDKVLKDISTDPKTTFGKGKLFLPLCSEQLVEQQLHTVLENKDQDKQEAVYPFEELTYEELVALAKHFDITADPRPHFTLLDDLPEMAHSAAHAVSRLRQ